MRTLALLALLPLAACGDAVQVDIDPGESGSLVRAIESGVEAHLTERYGVSVESVDCDRADETPSAEVGAVVNVRTCTVAQVGGPAFQAVMTSTNVAQPDGTIAEQEIFSTPSALVIPATEQQISAHYSEQVGGGIEASCDGPRVVLLTPGDTVDCTISDGTDERPVRVVINTEDGDIDFGIVE